MNIKRCFSTVLMFVSFALCIGLAGCNGKTQEYKIDILLLGGNKAIWIEFDGEQSPNNITKCKAEGDDGKLTVYISTKYNYENLVVYQNDQSLEIDFNSIKNGTDYVKWIYDIKDIDCDQKIIIDATDCELLNEGDTDESDNTNESQARVIALSTSIECEDPSKTITMSTTSDMILPGANLSLEIELNLHPTPTTKSEHFLQLNVMIGDTKCQFNDDTFFNVQGISNAKLRCYRGNIYLVDSNNVSNLKGIDVDTKLTAQLTISVPTSIINIDCGNLSMTVKTVSDTVSSGNVAEAEQYFNAMV